MPCQKCVDKPGYHSFIHFGDLSGTKMFYTALAKTEDYNRDGTKLANISIHIDENTAGGPWIWLFDCSNMGFHNYTDVSFNISLLKLLAKNPTIQGVWVVHPNTWIRGVHSFFSMFSRAPLLDRFSYFEGSGAELMNDFLSRGLHPRTIEWLLSQ